MHDNISSNREKVDLMLSSHVKIHRQICLGLFLFVNGTWSLPISLLKQMRWIYLFIYFFYWGYHWICFSQTCSFSLHKMLIHGFVDYGDDFISCLDSHSDGTQSLQSIHWWASDVIINLSKVPAVTFIFEAHYLIRWHGAFDIGVINPLCSSFPRFH